MRMHPPTGASRFQVSPQMEREEQDLTSAMLAVIEKNS